MRYWVDWEDEHYPMIRKDSYTGYRTLAEAKAEIIEHYQSRIEHARTQIKRVRSLKKSDI